MKEKLQEYALIAEIISAVAIVASLIFVGLQINQSSTQAELNTKAIELEVAASYTNQMNSIELFLLEDNGILGMIGRKIRGEEIPLQENFKIDIFLRSQARVWQSAYFQHQNSSLDDAFIAQLEVYITEFSSGNK